MKQFFKTIFACVLGIFIAGILGTFIMFFVFVGVAATSTTTYTPEKNTIFKLSLNNEVVEDTNIDPMSEILNVINEKKSPLALNEILSSIEIE